MLCGYPKLLKAYLQRIQLDGWIHRMDGWMDEPYLILDTDRKEEGENYLHPFEGYFILHWQ